MNTASLKTFAPAVRTKLMEAVTRKLDFVLTAQTPDYLTTFAPQVAELRRLAQTDRIGLIDRVAYTWFNRFAALRFMDARGWHPFRVRVLTPAGPEETQPELLKAARTGALPEELGRHTDPQRLNDLLDGRIPSPDAQGEVYRHLVLAACRFYHALLPDLFEKLDDETELLLPDDLLTQHSVVHGFRTEISDDDCVERDGTGGERANVEILGWLYQFYISEKKDAVMARKSAVPTEDIPAVTQLFTPHWIVRYLVENSLGRLWLLNRPSSRLRQHMPYYIEGEAETDFPKIATPEEIRVCDPACGSGHMLTYAFDLLYLIYEEEGYAPTEIPALILRHNLHGLEICPRATQLAQMALVFKAREKSRRFLQPEHLVPPRILELQNVHFEDAELSAYFQAIGHQPSAIHPQLLPLLQQFEEAKNFGSLIQPCLDERAIADVRRAIEAKDHGGQLFLRGTHLKVLRVLEQAGALTQRYHVVVANPPYMGSGGMNRTLKNFVESNWQVGKADMYAAFLLRNIALVQPDGYIGMITIPNWLFIAAFEQLRTLLIQTGNILNLIHCGRGVWGADFGSCAFVINSSPNLDRLGVFKRLFAQQGEVQTNDELIANFFNQEDFPNYFSTNSTFRKIPGTPIAYWASRKVIKAFKSPYTLREIADPAVGLFTCNNERFVRMWHEVASGNTAFCAGSKKEAASLDQRWFPYNKGGEFRKWFGNNFHVVNFYRDGEEVRNYRVESGQSRSLPGEKFYFQEGITWSFVNSKNFGVRVTLKGFVFDVGGSSIFPHHLEPSILGAFLCSKVAAKLLLILNPTINFQVGNIASLPWNEIGTTPFLSDILKLSTETVNIARADWNNFETSWDFRDQPLLRPSLKSATLEAGWRNWEAQSTAAIRRMQELETENNRLFIAAYSLDGELQPEVPEAQITLARAEARRDMAAFLSYAIGCMMGRYSPDHPGLILANAGDTLREFLEKVGKPLEALTFAPDEDGILPVLDGEWFEDDIVARVREFLRATFGEATLRENVRFIEQSLGKDLRKYFLNDFYKDHLQTYKKRPIYWMVQSPKKGFQCLIYLHRYTRDTPENPAEPQQDQSPKLFSSAPPAPPSLAVPAQNPEEGLPKPGHLVVPENTKGWSYRRLFAAHLKGASKITVSDPYIRHFFQARNLMELLQMIYDLVPEGDEAAVHLITQSDPDTCVKQEENLNQIAASFVSGAQGAS